MNSGFRHNLRGIGEIHKYGGDFYRAILNRVGGFSDFVRDAYEGFEHRPSNLKEKICNITRIWNLPLNAGGFLYGSSLGHVHSDADFQTQEIYEFLNYGGMLISSEEGSKLYVCKPGDKVVVPSCCMMTILNFSFGELETLDFANPSENESSKSILISGNRGPMLAFYHTGMNGKDRYCSLFNCSSFLSHRFARRIDFPTHGIVKMRINSKYNGFYRLNIIEDMEVEFKIGNEDGDLVSEILENRDKLKKIGIDVIECGSSVSCIGRDGRSYCLRDSLESLVAANDKILHKVFGII